MIQSAQLIALKNYRYRVIAIVFRLYVKFTLIILLGADMQP